MDLLPGFSIISYLGPRDTQSWEPLRSHWTFLSHGITRAARHWS